MYYGGRPSQVVICVARLFNPIVFFVAKKKYPPCFYFLIFLFDETQIFAEKMEGKVFVITGSNYI